MDDANSFETFKVEFLGSPAEKNLERFREAEKALLAAKTETENWKARLEAKQQFVDDQNRKIAELQARYEKLLADNRFMDERLQGIRVLLELVGVNLGQAIVATGYDYSKTSKP